MKKTGRKPYWETRIEPRLFEIAGWARDGHTEKDICEALGISTETFRKYKREKVVLFEALKVNKAIADLTVKNSLYKRANGFSYDEITTEVRKDKEGVKTSSVQKKVMKTVLPDTVAAMFWLKNRDGKNWKEKHDEKDSTIKPQPIKVEIIAQDGRRPENKD